MEIQQKLQELEVEEITVQPYINEQDWDAPPTRHDDIPLEIYEGWIFTEPSGVVYMVDGVSNQGFGDVMV